MPSTIDIDFDHNLLTISGRTDAAGDDEAVHDVNAGDVRLVASAFTQGAVTEDAFVLAVDSGMDLLLGSGTVGHDVYCVEGERWNYLVSLESAGVTVSVPASDAQQRTDEVYLVVLHDQFDSSGLALARIGYRRGDAGGGAPGPDAGWDACALLHQVTVPGSASEIVAEDLSDQRVSAGLNATVAGGTFPALTDQGDARWLRRSGGLMSGAIQLLNAGNVVRGVDGANIYSEIAGGSSYFRLFQAGSSVTRRAELGVNAGAVFYAEGDRSVRFFGNVQIDGTLNGASPARIASGTYTGNDTSNRLITVGFRPRHVTIIGGANLFNIILPAAGSGMWHFSGSGATAGLSYSGGEANGFRVGSSHGGANTSGIDYFWVAHG